MVCQWRRVLPVAVLALSVGLGWAGTASAHAAYKDSDPADESTVSSSPASVWAEFTEPLSQASTLKIFDPCGSQVDAGDVQIAGYRMTVSMSSQMAGEFTVAFVANSSLDGHTTNGEFTFISSSGDPCTSGSDDKTGASQPDAQSSDQTAVASETQAPAAEENAAPKSTDSADGATSDASAKDRGKSKRKPRADIELAADQTPEPPSEPSLFGDMPWGSFGVALLFALLIGAAGGKVYAGIMGPRA
jgi:methionine-rich copper-binding protein CopC